MLMFYGLFGLFFIGWLCCAIGGFRVAARARYQYEGLRHSISLTQQQRDAQIGQFLLALDDPKFRSDRRLLVAGVLAIVLSVIAILGIGATLPPCSIPKTEEMCKAPSARPIR